MRVVSLKICPFVQRVTSTLEAKHKPYDIEYVDLSHPPEWFLAVSPNEQVPLLITDNGTTLFESDAIVEYLDDIYQPLQQGLSPEQRAINRAWCYQASNHYLVQCGAMRSADSKTLQTRTQRLGRAFARVERVIGDEGFFNGQSVGNVDIAWLPLLHRAAIIEQKTGYDFLQDYPKVKAWQAVLLQQGIAEKSVPQDFETVFCDFYLSDRTFLGLGKDCTDVLP